MTTAAPPIRPGRLVLVVGPSGSGKDTLIAGAKAAFNGDGTIVFPRRIVTRRASASEDHDSLTDTAFDCARDSGAFAFWWEAHGLKYAIPAAIGDDIRSGRTVVCNVSRAILPALRSRYANAVVILITAPEDILAARLRERQRDSDGSLEERIRRNNGFAALQPDCRIDNVGGVDAGVSALCQAIRGKAEA